MSFLNKWLCAILIFFSFIIFILSAYAKELGTVGEIYPIQEEDLLTFIQHRLQTMKDKGEWQQLQNKMRERVKSHADRPFPLHLTKATQNKSFNYDPSIVLSHNLTDNKGHVFAYAGMHFNPLDVISLRSILIFYDGDDRQQIVWVQKIIQELKVKNPQKSIKLILTSGSISSQEKIFHQRIYFDQKGQLTRHFHIEHVPAMVEQAGKTLKISEVAV